MTHTLVHGLPKRRSGRILLVFLLGALWVAPGCVDRIGIDPTAAGYRITTVVEGLERPWGLAFLPDGRLLVTERAGRLRIVDGGRIGAPLAGVPEVAQLGQGGLLDVALHPAFETNGWVYLTHAKGRRDGAATTALVRGRLEGNALVDVEELFVAEAWTRTGAHFGSRLAFDRAGLLYMTVGDRGVMEEAQDRSNHQGTTLRLNDDGTPAADNPFVGVPGVLPEIFTYGNRSPQGLAVHPTTGAIWQTEHGPRGGDEINLLLPGANYGWPVITYGIDYDGSRISDRTEMDGMEQPLHYWDPSIATSGLALYQGEAFPEWNGSAFVGGLAAELLARVAFDGTRVVAVEKLLAGRGDRIRDVRQGPDDLLYVLVDADSAPLYRLEPVDSGESPSDGS